MEEFRQAAKGVAASDVVSLLREVYRDGVCGRQDAEALIAFDREFPDPTPEWRSFLAQAIADHLLRRSGPFGIVTQEKADWLIGALAPAGSISTRSGIETLTAVAELAEELPTPLAAFAIRELWITRGGERAYFSCALDARDVALLRHILKAGGGKSGAPVSIEEAEALFDLHDAVAAKKNHTSFDTLFFRAITNYLQNASGRETPPRAKALAREPRRYAGDGIAAECSAWLYSRVMRDGRPTAAERSLLALVHGKPEHKSAFGRLLNRAA